MNKPSYNAPALRHGVRLIEVLSASPQPMGLSALAQAIDSNIHMATRLVRTLQDLGWVVERPGKTYAMSMQPLRIFSKLLPQSEFRERAQHHARSLRDACGECIHLDQLDEDQLRSIIIDAWETTRHMIRVAPAVGGGRDHLHTGASGKAMLTWTPGLLDTYLAKRDLKRITATTITDPQALGAELKASKARGWTADNEEGRDGIFCLAAPVFDLNGALAGTICTTVLRMYYPDFDSVAATLAEQIVETATSISRELGFKPDQTRE